MSNASPIDTLKFVRARSEDLLEHVQFHLVATHEDEELAGTVESLRAEINQAIDQHLDDHPLVYGNGNSVKTELTVDHITHVRFPSHPARGGDAS